MLHMSGNVERFVNRALISVALVRMMAATHSASRKMLTVLEPMTGETCEWIAHEAKGLISRSNYKLTLCSITI